jgi:RNA polymerase sigma-70 factor (ECF subfamily)
MVGNSTFERIGQSEITPLVRRCLSGDNAAWDRLLGEARRLSLESGRWHYRLNGDDAEDVAQVVQVRVAQRLAQLRDPVAFPLWVRRLIHHAALDFLRQRRPVVSLEDLPSAADRPAPESASEFDQIDLRTDLTQALARLPELYREPIQLHVLQGLPQDEVSRILHRPRSTVATQIERGLRRLKRSLPPAFAA